MLYHLLYPLSDVYSALNVFQYLTFRTAYSAITALLISFFFGPWIIRRLGLFRIGQQIRAEGPSSHQQKAGTPTMGGVLILVAILVPTLLWANLTNRSIWLILFTMVSLGLLGFLDDYLHTVRRTRAGLNGRWKLLVQILVGMIAAVGIIHLHPFGEYPSTQTSVPFLKDAVLNLGILYIPFVILVVTGSSNAVNLADGLDGLAIGLTIPPAMAFGALAYVSGNVIFSGYLNIPYLEGAGELAVFAGALIGASMGFLWFNTHPASVFMGDTGSLALGGSLGMLAVLVKRELLLVIVGGIFVAETLSVVIQVLSFRYRRKRVFLMAPLHHHFELMGWPEQRIVVRFWIVAILLALVTLSTVKLQ